MNKLLNTVCLIEIYNIKNVCKFYYKGNFCRNNKIYLNYDDYIIKNDYIHITRDNSENISDKWINTLYFKDVYKDDNLFYKYLKSKYRV